MPIPLAQKIKSQRILVTDLSKRWDQYIKIAQTFDRNGLISDVKGRIKAEKDVRKAAEKYTGAVDKLALLIAKKQNS
jgi:hypothetical protein